LGATMSGRGVAGASPEPACVPQAKMTALANKPPSESGTSKRVVRIIRTFLCDP
jgi:hypothetical protein